MNARIAKSNRAKGKFNYLSNIKWKFFLENNNKDSFQNLKKIFKKKKSEAM